MNIDLILISICVGTFVAMATVEFLGRWKRGRARRRRYWTAMEKFKKRAGL